MSAKQLPRDCRGTVIGFGDLVAYAVSNNGRAEYSALRVGIVYGMKHEPFMPEGRQFLIQVENEVAENLYSRFGTRRTDKLIVVEKVK